MTSFEIEIPLAAFASVVKIAVDGTEKRTQSAVERAVEQHRGAMIRSFRAYTGTSDDRLQSRSGTLKRSFATEVTATTARSYVAGPKYGRLQELGGTIKPTKGKQFLTIPLKAALQPSGVVREGARMRKTGSGWETTGLVPRQLDTKTFIVRMPDGTPIIAARKKDKHKSLLPLYVLKRQVKIKPRLRFMATWAEQEPAREKRFAKALADGIQEGAK